LHDEDGEIVIDGTAARAAIDGEGDLADAPGQRRGPAVLQRGKSDLFEFVGELARVAVDAGLMLLRNRLAEERRADVLEHRAGVGVRRGDGEAVAADTGFLAESCRNFLDEVIGNAEVVRGDEDGGTVLVSAEGERLRRDTLRDSLRLRAAGGEA